MTITPQKIIKSKLELNNDEIDIILDFKTLLDRIQRGMQETNTDSFTMGTLNGNVTVTELGIGNMKRMTEELFQVCMIIPES